MPGRHLKKWMGDIMRSVCPIQVNSSEWLRKETPERIQKTYELQTRDNALFFLNELLKMEDSLGHHGAILISENRVTIQLRTKVVDRVTDLDIEYAHRADDIYEDTTYMITPDIYHE